MDIALKLFVCAIVYAFWIWIASLIFQFSNNVGFWIWFALMVLMVIAEIMEFNLRVEAANNKTCVACAERIRRKAKKCRFCGENQEKS